jgi:hypothetical protein
VVASVSAGFTLLSHATERQPLLSAAGTGPGTRRSDFSDPYVICAAALYRTDECYRSIVGYSSG